MDAPDFNPSHAVWRTSSYTNNGGACVEVADNQPGVVAVRDSKDRRGPILAFSREDWRAFVRASKDGRPGVSPKRPLGRRRQPTAGSP